MKKYFNYALIGAIALTGSTMLAGCSSSDDATADITNPNYDASTGLVKSQFVLNIASKAQTRSGATTVQAGGENFRGIDNTLLFAFKTSGKGFVDASSAAAAAANSYDLGTVAAAGSLDNDGSNSHRILELSMPTGTDAMLFYGKAIKSSTDKDEEVGKVTYAITGTQATGGTTPFHFDLNNRVAGNSDKYEHAAQILAAIMTKIVNVSGTYTVVKANYPSWSGSDGDVLTSTWKDLNPTTQGRTLSPLEEILHIAFTSLTSYGANELRGGSSNAIHTTVKDLYSVTIKVANATPTSPYEELAQHLAQQINTQINNYFTSSETEAVTGFKGADVVKSSMGASWNDDWNDVVTIELQNFPVTNFTLPEGTAQLEYTASTNTFSHKHPGTSLLDKSTTTDPNAYMFPAELMYYCNSGVRTSNKEKTSASGYPNGVANWDDNTKWDSDWTGTSVTSATRATAMTKNVNYGVAMLKTTVQIKEGITALEDNRKALNPGEENKSFSPANIDFTWTGVIIGDQPASVDWQFLPLTSSTFDKLVYDNQVAGEAAGTAVPKTAGSASAPNYTILFDNYTSAATQNKVRVALQFVNNGDDFWGRDNLVRKGQTFYLVAELDPAKTGLTAPTWDEYYQVPPLNASGVSTKTTRVFIQDYMTTVNFKFTADASAHTSSLQNAYVTIPDLRSSQLSFGLSVDLNWRTGLVFTEELGGN